MIDPNPAFACPTTVYPTEKVVVIGVDLRPSANPMWSLPYSPVFDNSFFQGFLFGPNALLPSQLSFSSLLETFTHQMVFVDPNSSKAGGWYFMPPYGPRSGHLEYYCRSVNAGLGTDCDVSRILSDVLYSMVVGMSTGPKVADDIGTYLVLAGTMTHVIFVVGGMDDGGVFLPFTQMPNASPVVLSSGKEKFFLRLNSLEDQDPTFSTSAGATLLPYLGGLSDTCISWSVVTAEYFRDNQASFIDESLNALYLGLELFNGEACSSNSQCLTGNCVDGVCCDSACGGGSTTDCQACSVAAGAAVDGTCTALSGTTCDDGNASTVNDVCAAGVCAGTDLCANVTCTALDQCHVAGTCDRATGLCSNPVVSNGTTCNDGNACTQTDSCQAGACVGATPVTCTALDQCHVAGTCDPNTGTCSNPNASNGTACNDGNACTQSDICQGGACTGTNVCPTNQNQCKNGGWRSLLNATGQPFKNQGECVSYVNTGTNHADKCADTDTDEHRDPNPQRGGTQSLKH